MTTIALRRAPHAEPPVPAAPPTGRPLWLIAMLVGLGMLYALTASWSDYKVDPFSNAVQAHAWAADGTPAIAGTEAYLGDPGFQRRLIWLVDSPEGPTTQYPPGVAWWGALFYLPFTDAEVTDVAYQPAGEEVTTARLRLPSMAPATVAAIVSVLVALGCFGLTIRDQIGDRAAAVAVALAGTGTGMWSVAADRLWQHGPTMMCISLGTYLTSRDRFLGAGLAFGAGIVIRPHLALIAAAVGITVSVSQRRVGPMLRVGLGAGAGLTVLLTYNYWLWDTLTVSGGYGDTFTQRTVTNGPNRLGAAIVDFFVHPRVGILVTSVFLVPAFLGLYRLLSRRPPAWAVGAAVGAVAYTLLQLQANRVTGGSHFFGYRYALEPLMAAAPLLAIATVGWLGAGRRPDLRAAVFAALALLSVAAHGYGATFVW